MGNIEFKLQMYFSMYKDAPLENRGKFREKFKKKHGEFQFLNELILMIEKHQIKTYGGLLYRSDDGILKDRHDVRRLLNASRHMDSYKKERR